MESFDYMREFCHSCKSFANKLCQLVFAETSDILKLVANGKSLSYGTWPAIFHCSDKLNSHWATLAILTLTASVFHSDVP